MKKIVFLFLFVASGACYGQIEKEIDSLNKVIQSSSDFYVKAKNYLKISKLVGDKDTNFQYIDEAIRYSKLSKDSYIMYLCCKRKATLVEIKSGTDEAILETKKFIPYFRNSKSELTSLYYDIGLKFGNKSVGDSTLLYLNKGIALATEINRPVLLATGFMLLGNKAFYEFDYKTAMTEYLKVDSICEKSDSLRVSSYRAKNYNYIGYAVRKPYGYKETLKYYLKSKQMYLQLNNNDGIQEVNIGIAQLLANENKYNEALPLINEAIAYQKKINGKAYSYAIIIRGYIYLKMKNFEEAEKDYLEYYRVVIKEKEKKLEGKAYGYLGHLYKEKKDYDKAAFYYNKALNFSDNKYNEKMRELYEEVIELYTESKDIDNLTKTYEEYIKLRDTIEVQNKNKDIFELETKYQTEKKNNEIIRLSDLQILNQLELEKQAALLKGNLAEAQKKQIEISLLSQAKQLQEAKLFEQQNTIQQKNLALSVEQQKSIVAQNELKIAQQESKIKSKDAQLQKLLRNGIAIASLIGVILALGIFNRYKLKKELAKNHALLHLRNSISKDLHDEIGSTLTSIHILSSIAQKANEQQPIKAKEMLSQITDQSKNIQQNMSDIVWSMRSENDDMESLFIRVKEFLHHTTEPAEIEAEINIPSEILKLKLPIAFRKEILLICKEAITNTVKHADASLLSISANIKQSILEIEISDNGKWKGSTSGSGQKNMQERAHAIGGTLAVTSNETGTTVIANIPIT